MRRGDLLQWWRWHFRQRQRQRQLQHQRGSPVCQRPSTLYTARHRPCPATENRTLLLTPGRLMSPLRQRLLQCRLQLMSQTMLLGPDHHQLPTDTRLHRHQEPHLTTGELDLEASTDRLLGISMEDLPPFTTRRTSRLCDPHRCQVLRLLRRCP